MVGGCEMTLHYAGRRKTVYRYARGDERGSGMKIRLMRVCYFACLGFSVRFPFLSANAFDC